jgi:hypothetical protein
MGSAAARTKERECECAILLLLASKLRSRAEEVLVRGANMDDAQAQDIMRAVAMNYEKLAQRIELFAA